ncbi:MAG: response regulator transcription factor [Acidobacteria bacterium]|nr:response regulator transcription factor [Acidobacteriota bacterium]
MKKIRILIADDHAILRQGIRKLLEAEPDMEVVEEAVEGMDAVQKANRLLPDVVVMDYSMPGLNGLQATHRIKKIDPHIKVLILTMHEDEEYIVETLREGASGYLLKDATSKDLISAIRAVHRGEAYLSPSVSRKVVDEFLEYRKETPLKTGYERLTDREKEVLKLLADGMAVKEIANLLEVSAKTVDAHKTNLMRKLGIHDRGELIKYAIKRKIIKVDS